MFRTTCRGACCCAASHPPWPEHAPTQVARHRGFDGVTAHDDPAAHGEADEEHRQPHGMLCLCLCLVSAPLIDQCCTARAPRNGARSAAHEVASACLRCCPTHGVSESSVPRWATLMLKQHSRVKLPRCGQSACWHPTALYHSFISLTRLFRRYDCHPVKSFAPMLAQAPLFICFFLAIKRMAVLPSFQSGGAAWFMDLAVADPTYMLPLLSGATFLATVEVRALCAPTGSPARNAILTCRCFETTASWVPWMACRATRPPTT